MVDASRLNCGCRRGLYFRREISTLEAGANAPPRNEFAGIIAIVLSREVVVKSGRSEAILGRAALGRRTGNRVSDKQSRGSKRGIK